MTLIITKAPIEVELRGFGPSKLIPTPAYPMTALRQDRTLITAWMLRPSGVIEEMWWRSPDGYAGVEAGWELWLWRAILPNGTRKNWLVQPVDHGLNSTTAFAMWAGRMADSYEVAGRYYQGGYGHGHMLAPAANQSIVKDGIGPNLFDVSAWAPGTPIRGQSLAFGGRFDILMPPEVGAAAGSPDVPAIRIEYSQAMTPTLGCNEIGTFYALVPGVGFQDAAVAMHAVTAGDVDTARLGDDPATIPLTRDGTQKGNWTATTSGLFEFFKAADPVARPRLLARKGPVIQNYPDENLTPYQFVEPTGNRAHVTDQTDYAKFRAYATSAIAGHPRIARALPMGTKLFWDHVRSTELVA